jgi:RNA polymerase-binding transcription factor DksA
MPDAMDAVQSQTDAHLENALQHHANRPRTAGLTHCENLDCREPISEARQAMGARLCVPCGKAEEAQAAHFGAWSRR